MSAAPSNRWAGPRARLLDGPRWEAMRTDVLTLTGPSLTEDAGEHLARLTRGLAEPEEDNVGPGHSTSERSAEWGKPQQDRSHRDFLYLNRSHPTSKDFSSRVNPDRFALDLFRSRSWPSSGSVQTSVRPSGSHLCRLPRSLRSSRHDQPGGASPRGRREDRNR